MSGYGRNLMCGLGFLVVLGAVPAHAQESLDSGKTAAQLFASDCAICHKTPQGLAKPGRISGLNDFLRQHYTASRESAAAIAAYLQSVGKGPAAPVPGRAAKRTGKGDNKAKGAEKKPEPAKSENGKSGDEKPGDGKPADAKTSEPKTSEPKTSEPKTSEPKAAEPKSSEPKAAEPKPSEPKASEPTAGEGKASEPKPAEGGKSD
jgi:hypothetical protein